MYHLTLCTDTLEHVENAVIFQADPQLPCLHSKRDLPQYTVVGLNVAVLILHSSEHMLTLNFSVHFTLSVLN